jgi:uncharacterized membrane protein
MSITKHFIFLLVVIIVAIVIIIPILSKVNEDTTIIHSLPQTATTLLAIFPLWFIGVAILVSVFSLFSSRTDEEFVDEEMEEPEDIKEVEKDARSILMKRYINGEISDEEYTNKMARL